MIDSLAYFEVINWGMDGWMDGWIDGWTDGYMDNGINA